MTKIFRAASIFAMLAAACAFAAVFLSLYCETAAGIFLGSALAVSVFLVLLPWKRKALATQAMDILKISGCGSVLRLLCLIGIGFWGFKGSFAVGLAGIISFGFVFLATTVYEMKHLWIKN
ncbi:MAG: hypothetical protein HY401_07250 [Elusimicrobia bacterium]|nr:hypothetical protein [Elusimicrobiota bacterium]